MRSTLLALIIAAVIASPAAFAGKGNGGDPPKGPPITPPGPPSPPPGQPPSPPGPPSTPPGQSRVKVTPPAGTCVDDSTAIDVQGPDGQSGKSSVAHTTLGKMDIATGAAVESSSTASLMYFWYGSAFDYVLNAHQLDAGTQWTLTYQPEPLPSSGVICLGAGTVNDGGQLHIANSIDIKSNLPTTLDPTADPSTQPPNALLALVSTSDVDCTAGTMTTFTPDKYLWTNPRVRYVDTNLLPKP